MANQPIYSHCACVVEWGVRVMQHGCAIGVAVIIAPLLVLVLVVAVIVAPLASLVAIQVGQGPTPCGVAPTTPTAVPAKPALPAAVARASLATSLATSRATTFTISPQTTFQTANKVLASQGLTIAIVRLSQRSQSSQRSQRSLGTPTASTAGSTATPTPSGTPTSGGSCINPDGNVVVQWALAMSAALYDCPNIFDPGQLPPWMDVCWTSNFPAQAIAWWAKTCGGCPQAENGNLQCVMYAAAAFGLAGLPLYFGPNNSANAIDFWTNYAHYPGWIEIPSGWGAPDQRGLPAPGDMMVWYESFAPTEGHITVVLAVRPPQGSQLGSVTFGEANGPEPIMTETINPDLTVNTWSGGTVVGYIRFVGNHPLRVPSAGG